MKTLLETVLVAFARHPLTPGFMEAGGIVKAWRDKSGFINLMLIVIADGGAAYDIKRIFGDSVLYANDPETYAGLFVGDAHMALQKEVGGRRWAKMLKTGRDRTD